MHTVGQVVWKVTNEDEEICVTKTSDRPVDKRTPHLKGDNVILSLKKRHAAVRTGPKHTFRLNRPYRCDLAQTGSTTFLDHRTQRRKQHFILAITIGVKYMMLMSDGTKQVSQKAQRDPVKTFHQLGKSPGDTRSSVMKCPVP